MKKKLFQVIAVGAILLAASPSGLHAELISSPPLGPNEGGSSIMIPSGWGAYGGMVFGGFSFTTPQVYANVSDGNAGVGFGVGNPYKNVGVEMSVAMMDLSQQDNFSVGVKLHRNIAEGTSIGVGALNLFHDSESDADDSYYVVASHAVQGMQSETQPYESKLLFTLGVGNGMFGDMSPIDIKAGKNEHGTYVFGSVAYEVFRATNVVVEWSGINLNAGVSSGLLKLGKNMPVNVTIAAGDLTSYSGDGVRLLSSLNTAILF
jgi:hypothetical protein